MKKNRRFYNGAFKAEVVMEYLKGKKSIEELSEQYLISPQQIRNWKSLFLKRAGEVLEDQRCKKP